jgi:hypothetical protein
MPGFLIILGDLVMPICFLEMSMKLSTSLGRPTFANPRVWLFHLWLAGALGLRGDLERANSALTESLRHKPEINSLARLHALYPLLMDLPHRVLAEKTLYLGLRRAGFPDE